MQFIQIGRDRFLNLANVTAIEKGGDNSVIVHHGGESFKIAGQDAVWLLEKLPKLCVDISALTPSKD